MLKLIGALLVIASCTALSAKIIVKKKNSLTALSELSDSLQEIARSIDFNLESLPDIIFRLGQNQFKNEDTFLNRLSKEIAGNPGDSFDNSWAKISHDYVQAKSLPDDVKSILSGLGSTLGKMDSETEIARLSNCQKRLNKLKDELETEHQKTEKMIQSLGVILGIFIVILCI